MGATQARRFRRNRLSNQMWLCHGSGHALMKQTCCECTCMLLCHAVICACQAYLGIGRLQAIGLQGQGCIKTITEEVQARITMLLISIGVLLCISHHMSPI